MRKIILILTATFALGFAVSAQTTNTTTQTASATTKSSKPPIFRANKDQIIQAQKMLKVAESGRRFLRSLGANEDRRPLSV